MKTAELLRTWKVEVTAAGGASLTLNGHTFELGASANALLFDLSAALPSRTACTNTLGPLVAEQLAATLGPLAAAEQLAATLVSGREATADDAVAKTLLAASALTSLSAALSDAKQAAQVECKTKGYIGEQSWAAVAFLEKALSAATRTWGNSLGRSET